MIREMVTFNSELSIHGLWIVWYAGRIDQSKYPRFDFEWLWFYVLSRLQWEKQFNYQPAVLALLAAAVSNEYYENKPSWNAYFNNLVEKIELFRNDRQKMLRRHVIPGLDMSRNHSMDYRLEMMTQFDVVQLHVFSSSVQFWVRMKSAYRTAWE